MRAALGKAGAGRFWLLWAAVLPLSAWAVIRGFGLEHGWQMTALMWFTPYAALAAVFTFGVAIALRNWPAASIGALAAIWLALGVLPRTSGELEAVAGRETLMVLSANVERGEADPRGLVALVRRYRPDLLSVQELTPSFARRLGELGLGQLLPHSALMASPKGHGGGLYSRFRLRLLADQRRALFRMPRAELTLPSGQVFHLVAVHPQPPTMDLGAWERGLDSLPRSEPKRPWVLLGDFNATEDQSAFRSVLGRGYEDAAATAGMGLVASWPSEQVFPWGLMTIDHVLFDETLGLAEYGVDPLPGSDHRAIHALLIVSRDRAG